MTRSSTPHAPLGKSSSLNPKRSPPSECAIGLMSVSHYDPWYKPQLYGDNGAISADRQPRAMGEVDDLEHAKNGQQADRHYEQNRGRGQDVEEKQHAGA